MTRSGAAASLTFAKSMMRAPGVAPPPGRMILTPLRALSTPPPPPDRPSGQCTWVRGPGALGANALASFEISAIGCGAVALLREASVSRGGVSRGAVPGAANPIPAWSSGVASLVSPAEPRGKSAKGANGAKQVETAKCNPDVRQYSKRRTLSNRELSHRLSFPSLPCPGACPNRRKIHGHPPGCGRPCQRARPARA
jgi:hypothetical protein